MTKEVVRIEKIQKVVDEMRGLIDINKLLSKETKKHLKYGLIRLDTKHYKVRIHREYYLQNISKLKGIIYAFVSMLLLDWDCYIIIDDKLNKIIKIIENEIK